MFVQKDNAWKTKVAMAQEPGLSANKIHTLLYGEIKDRFRNRPGVGRAKLYRLTEDALQKAKKGVSP